MVTEAQLGDVARRGVSHDVAGDGFEDLTALLESIGHHVVRHDVETGLARGGEGVEAGAEEDELRPVLLLLLYQQREIGGGVLDRDVLLPIGL